jgi:acyl-[acyl-carrier-protein]-phospholipid O-acyltransferase/long-chain-fatty-acid--[acyl-carrier-protein] ligase
MNQQNNLFLDKRFMPLFITQFCGCLNDSILKSALIIMVMYKISSNHSDEWVLLINAIFILPFIFFASIAGQIADKYEKSFLIKLIKFCEIFIVMLGIYGFMQSNLALLLSAITLMGVHSAFFGTLKFSIIPDHLEKEEFLKSSGYIEFGTFIGILMGTLLGGMYNFIPNFIYFLMILVALIGF